MTELTGGTAKSVAEAIDVIRRVPDAYREFVVDPKALRRLHFIDEAMLRRLLDHGLPHRVSGHEVLVDTLDAQNLGLLLGLRSPRRISMRWWGAALAAADLHQARIFTMRVALEEGTIPEGCPSSLSPELLASALPGSVSQVSHDSFIVQARLSRPARPFGPEFGPLIEQLSRLKFHLIPTQLRTNIGFVAESGLADCQLATRFAVIRAAELGLPVRSAEGLLVVGPNPTRHSWLEFKTDGEWVAADPFILNALAEWGIVDRREWPPTRSPQSVLWRLSAAPCPLMIRDGRWRRCIVAILSEVPADDPTSRK
jgi:hypothetical protein